ncbi:hypothetical protein DQ04_03251130 [Trypanosoma grayi]|uniref:hypothetical protein n=1 Tax=Trypanosoma grayi TaxID=71804 RepID=UPI0004F3EF86|nr:hypothetical protein DQ04_03251130 [Trypanosoma grayi]KEG10835.1 hypothetical protein DQ04_03251130 [Trypanosoma grayi]
MKYDFVGVRFNHISQTVSLSRGAAGRPLYTIRLAQQRLGELLDNGPVCSPRQASTSATLAASALLFDGPGEELIAGGAWNKAPHMIFQAEARAVHLALRALRRQLEGPLHICGDSAAVAHIMTTSNAHSEALVREATAINRALWDLKVGAAWRYVASRNNPADGISRGQDVKALDLAKGSAGGG